MIKHALAILFVLLLAQVSVLAAVTVTWTDSAGAHNVALTLGANPEYVPGDPYSIEPKLTWGGAINVVMDTLGPIKFTFSGNFLGGSGSDYGVWYGVRVAQTVLNHTSGSWAGFNLWTENLVPDPNTTRDPTFYNMYEYSPGDWFLDQYPMLCNYYPEDPLVGPFVAVNSTFYDMVKVSSDVNLTTGDGGFYLFKEAVPIIPEPASMAAVAGGLAGLFAYVRRRKAQ